MLKKVAFTLAEVLITLGIIGVVAAMTIPTLVHYYQKKVWVRQLQTTKLKLEEGFRMAMADDGVDDIGATELWSLVGNYLILDTSEHEDILKFTNKLGQYIKVLGVEFSDTPIVYVNWLNDTAAGNSYNSKINLMSGATIIQAEFYGTNAPSSRWPDVGFSKIYSYLKIDVNGSKKPNVQGRDIFNFYLGNNGLLYPLAGKDYAIFYGAPVGSAETSAAYWGNSGADKWHNCTTTKKSGGYGCSARIIEEGWKMNY